MVKATFINLPQVKKDLITQALLNEFSHYPLQEAQVARIVKEAQIARGAFYKYFTDLLDAYSYLYGQALREIHADIKVTSEFEPQIFYLNVVNFVEKTHASKYALLIKMHVLYNESMLAKPAQTAKQADLSPQNWSAMVLSHAAIRAVLTNPSQKDDILLRFKASLELLQKGSN
ncbi:MULTISPECIES: TetR/AcrR family transcriptional regulator [unclassified Lactobacillus]|uniref:TetR/AcrR family transcriptional regulator n=1 Tax=unclassified Lactobacillus TaxID=2620435 RepID=UPI0023F953C5|nr:MULTISPECIES: TetR/AcrR family transcriptional regulator [unclassified Lactobacillus]MDF7669133.1 TetR/AcrR family transcriptional regulator [Lactobacillus sp. ESL0703]WEV38877.1 TetR/AcrR family transcriptional regulator [Lactobacillus sp. ESL0680]